MSAHDGGDGTAEVAESTALLRALKERTARSYGPPARRLGMNTSTLLPNDRLRSDGSGRPGQRRPPRTPTAAPQRKARCRRLPKRSGGCNELRSTGGSAFQTVPRTSGTPAGWMAPSPTAGRTTARTAASTSSNSTARSCPDNHVRSQQSGLKTLGPAATGLDDVGTRLGPVDDEPAGRNVADSGSLHKICDGGT